MKNFIAVLAVISALLAYNSFFVINEGEQAIVTRLGEYKASHRSPGLRFKVPYADSVHTMPKKILGSDTPPAEYLTLDKKKLVADPISRWRIVDPIKFYKSVRDPLGAKPRLDDIVNSELREEIARRDFGDIIGNKREDLVRDVADRARPKCAVFGIELIDVRIKRADLPSEVQESVFLRMRAERDREAKKYTAEGEEISEGIRAETNKEREILLAGAYEKSQKLRGEGDATSIAIYAEAYEKDADFYDFTQSLQTYEKVVDENTKVVLSTNNDLFKFLNSSK